MIKKTMDVETPPKLVEILNKWGVRVVCGIDPGLRSCGAAVVSREAIHTYNLRPTGFWEERISKICGELGESEWFVSADLLLIEHMVDYPGHKRRSNPNDLIKLGVLEGAIWGVSRAKFAMFVEPVRWKGSVPKHIYHKRMQVEHDWIPQKGVDKDSMDALGIALYGVQGLGGGCASSQKR